jgi:hypothetical protein
MMRVLKKRQVKHRGFEILNGDREHTSIYIGLEGPRDIESFEQLEHIRTRTFEGIPIEGSGSVISLKGSHPRKQRRKAMWYTWMPEA